MYSVTLASPLIYKISLHSRIPTISSSGNYDRADKHWFTTSSKWEFSKAAATRSLSASCLLTVQKKNTTRNQSKQSYTMSFLKHFRLRHIIRLLLWYSGRLVILQMLRTLQGCSIKSKLACDHKLNQQAVYDSAAGSYACVGVAEEEISPQPLLIFRVLHNPGKSMTSWEHRLPEEMFKLQYRTYLNVIITHSCSVTPPRSWRP